jgi:hypothetical protein
VSTPIWDSGAVSASITATLCDRCRSRDRCVALFSDDYGIDLCLSCFCDLAYQVGKADGDARLQNAAAALVPVDFIARLADAWDGRGQWTLNPHAEHRALLEIAGLSPTLCKLRWADFPGAERQALLLAARRAIEFGRQCAWVLGEGQGARF